MKTKNLQGIICLVIFFLFANLACAENMLNSDSYYDIIIAVTVNGDDNLMGKLEYSSYTLQLVTFNPVSGVIYTEPYIFEIVEKKIYSKNMHRIKCRAVNDKYGLTELIGTIDFRNEIKPKVHLVNGQGRTFITNISEKGKKTAQKYMPHVWLGQ
jgi:hypothetical protein